MRFAGKGAIPYVPLVTILARALLTNPPRQNQTSSAVALSAIALKEDRLEASWHASFFGNEPQADERAARCLVLCLSFADTFTTRDLFTIPDDVEDPQAPVVWPRNADLAVLGQCQSTRLGNLLQRRFGVRESQRPLVEVFQILGKLIVDKIERRLPSAIEDDRGDHRFEEIFEEGRSFPPPRELLTWPEDHPAIEAEQGGPFSQSF